MSLSTLRRKRLTRSERDAAKTAGLIYVTDLDPGIRRKRAGKSFTYVNDAGTRIKDENELRRIRSLAIPPAYEDVWICTNPRGHMQATGRDARRRKQYRYHPLWREERDKNKFSQLLEFGRRLPALRRRLARDLALPGLPREKVLAVVVTLLGQTMGRVGNMEYARTNKSYGLTTLQDKHAAFLRDGRALLKFRGKHGIQRELTIDDARLVKLLRKCRDVPGQHLFQYLDDAGHRQPVDSGMVNAYLHEAMGDSFTAKNFRTWGATLLALGSFAATPLPERGGDRAHARTIVGVVKEVASVLGNTPTVCRQSYIHPAVIDAWRGGWLEVDAKVASFPRKLEAAALDLVARAAKLERKLQRAA